jgi:hypothetical protein
MQVEIIQSPGKYLMFQSRSEEKKLKDKMGIIFEPNNKP